LKLRPGHDPKIPLIELKKPQVNQLAECRIRPANLMPTRHVKAGCVQLLIIMHKLWKLLKRVEERMERWIFGKRMILILM